MAGRFRWVSFVLAGGTFAGGLKAQNPAPGIVNWPAPLYWSPGEAGRALAEPSDQPEIRAKALASVPTSPLPFIGITPCRIADTRDASFPPGYGPPSLSPGVAAGRTFILAGQCGIAAGAGAVSLNVTAVNPLGVGYIVLYPQDGAVPPVSTLNYAVGQTVANAAVVPLGTGGAIRVVAGVSGTDLIIDTNGYYAASGVGVSNTFLGIGAGNFTMTGDSNTGIGSGALAYNTTGAYNTAVGTAALAINQAGNANVAVGLFALGQATTGSGNIALGFNAGANLVTGDNNLYLGNGGVASESNTVRIGIGGLHERAFVAAVRGVTTDNADAVPVLIDSAGQLGTTSSSGRFKEGIEEMAESSSDLLKLRPVTFHYKGQSGGRKQFGLIAEEVQEVLPELVVCDSTGVAETVLYHEMPAMLLNELQKQQRRIERQDEEIQALREHLAAVEAELRASAEGR